VLSAMGFYPVCPGKPVYTLGSPIFSRVVIHQDNGKNFTIRAEHASTANQYIQSTKLNGAPYAKVEITHADIVSGATLTLDLGSEPRMEANGR